MDRAAAVEAERRRLSEEKAHLAKEREELELQKQVSFFSQISSSVMVNGWFTNRDLPSVRYLSVRAPILLHPETQVLVVASRCFRSSGPLLPPIPLLSLPLLGEEHLVRILSFLCLYVLCVH